MQVLRTGRAARRAVFQGRKIDLIEQRAPQQPYVDRRRSTGKDADTMLREASHNLVGIVPRDHDQGSGCEDRHPGRIGQAPDVKHRRNIEENTLAEGDWPDADMLNQAPHQAAMRMVDALRNAGGAAGENR